MHKTIGSMHQFLSDRGFGTGNVTLLAIAGNFYVKVLFVGDNSGSSASWPQRIWRLTIPSTGKGRIVYGSLFSDEIKATDIQVKLNAQFEFLGINIPRDIHVHVVTLVWFHRCMHHIHIVNTLQSKLHIFIKLGRLVKHDERMNPFYFEVRHMCWVTW